MSEAVELLDPRVDPEPAGWADFLARERLWAPWDYGLMRLEACAAANPTVLVVAREHGEPVAACAMMMRRPRFGPRFAEVWHPWLSGEPGFYFAGQVTPADRPDVLRSMERAARRFLGVGCVGLVYRNVPPKDLDVVDGRARVRRDAVGTTLLDNSFRCFDDYLATLKGKRRRELRRQRRLIDEDRDLEVRSGTARTDLDPVELAELLSAHRAKYRVFKFDVRTPVVASYLAELIARKDVFTVSYHDGAGRLVAYNNALDHPGRMCTQHWAVRPLETGGRKHLYFDATSRMVERMIDQSSASLSMGRGLNELKGELGFTEQPLYAVIVPRPVAR